MTFFFLSNNAFHDQRTAAGHGWPSVARSRDGGRAAMAQDILTQIFLGVAKAVTDETGHVFLQKTERIYKQTISVHIAD
jgi:hypothetical protein